MTSRKPVALAFFVATFISAVFSQESQQKGTKIALPTKKKTAFFEEINPAILSLVEEGSPSSLVRALSSLRHSNDSYTPAEQVLLFIASSALRVCFPSEYKTEYAVFAPADLASNRYVGALQFALDGLYDFAAGDDDFLSLVIPSISLCISDTSASDSYSQAEKSLSAALKMRPKSVLANFLAGRLFTRQKRFSDATKVLELAHNSSPDCVEITFDFANALFYSNKIEEADILARSLVSLDSQNRKALKLCAETSFALGDWDSAEMYVARVLQQESWSAYYLLFRVKILIHKGDFIRAASLLDVYSRTDSTSRDYLLLRAKIQRDWNKNLSAATATIEKAVSLYKNDAEVLLEAASLASETGGTIFGKSAGELAEAVLSLDSQNLNAKIFLVQALASSKKWSEAYSISKPLVDSLGNDAPDSLIFAHISICQNSSKIEEAWNLASKLYSTRATEEAVVQAYLSVLIATGKKSDAQKILESLLPQSSAKLKSFLYYQKSFLDSGEDAILSDLRASLTANPRNRDSLFRLYEIYFAKKEYRKAQYYLKQVVALSPSDDSLLALNTKLDNLLKN